MEMILKKISTAVTTGKQYLMLLAVFVFTANVASAQKMELRLLNHWDNLDGTIERGFAGRSIFFKDGDVSYDPQRIEQYTQMNKAFGINGAVINNVNASPQILATEKLKKIVGIADIFRKNGLKLYLSINFASPMVLDSMKTADPLDSQVQQWWKKKVDEIYSLIPDFGGFLVKANSEGQPGPMDFGRTHADGANMLADVLAPHKGIVMWRAFVYAANSPDRASQAYEEFMPLDGKFHDNVILQIKNGPVDFQPREPVSPLFFALKHTKMMPELQITQEYTGESIHTCFLASMWKEFFDATNDVNFVGVAGVSNIGDSENWCGSDMAVANWVAFGDLAQTPTLSPYEIARDFLRKYYTTDERFVKPVAQLMVESHEAVVSYMMPMGLHHIFADGHHYGPAPWSAPKGVRADWTPVYYHKADSKGLGFDRMATGSNNIAQYPEHLQEFYSEISTENPLILWFHHVPWDYKMDNGKTMWQNLCMTYDRGVAKAEEFVKVWESIKPYIDEKRYNDQLTRFQRQAKDAWWWRDACLLYFQTFSKMPFPKGSPAPRHKLDDLMKYRLLMDNYTAADMSKLPD